jgi:hypothetical protein
MVSTCAEGEQTIRPPRNRVFICYSHKDEKHRARLRDYLRTLERAGLTEAWDDTRIDAGQTWREEIRNALESARVAVLLVSIDFLNSRFIADDELPPLLQAAKEEDVLILQVFVGPCKKAFEDRFDLEPFQTFNKPEKPFSKLSGHQRDEEWDRLADRIRSYLKQQGGARTGA